MKKLKHTIFICILFLASVKAKEVAGQDKDINRIEVTFNKTSTIVFPTIIKSVDRGSRDVLAQKAKGVENVVQLKAARRDFPETNLTVITADGNIHQFTLLYVATPTRLVYEIKCADDSDKSNHPLIFDAAMTESEMEQYTQQIISTKRSKRFILSKKNKIKLALHGIYCKDNVIFYHFRIHNNSNINYDVDFMRLFIVDQEKIKRTASQEVDIKPHYAIGNLKTIKGGTSEDIVYALEKFTIPDAKRLRIEMFEKNGGRNLSLSIRNRTIVNAKLTPNYTQH